LNGPKRPRELQPARLNVVGSGRSSAPTRPSRGAERGSGLVNVRHSDEQAEGRSFGVFAEPLADLIRVGRDSRPESVVLPSESLQRRSGNAPVPCLCAQPKALQVTRDPREITHLVTWSPVASFLAAPGIWKADGSTKSITSLGLELPQSAIAIGSSITNALFVSPFRHHPVTLHSSPQLVQHLLCKRGL
jgi:hypothetical protein